MTARYPRCDRPDCRRVYVLANASSDAERAYVEQWGCDGEPVDWRSRALSAEARLAEEQETIREIEAAAGRCGYDGDAGPDAPVLIADWIEAQHAETGRLRDRTTAYICAACGGFGHVVLDSLDSGTTLTCEGCGGKTVVDLDTPEQRAGRYDEAARLRDERDRYRLAEAKALDVVEQLTAERLHWGAQARRLRRITKMHLNLTVEGPGAEDFSYLLHKHPNKLFRKELGGFGEVFVYYPVADDGRASASLTVLIDTARGGKGRSRMPEEATQYVGDWAYASGTVLATALRVAFATALGGRCQDKPDAVGCPMHLTAVLPAVRARGGEDAVRRLFAPLGYEVTTTSEDADPEYPEWGESRALGVRLVGDVTLHALLTHLYLLLPCLDTSRYHHVGDAEVDKLLRHGEGWLDDHPERGRILSHYLRGKRGLIDAANTALAERAPEATEATEDEPEDEGGATPLAVDTEAARERPLRLLDHRLTAVLGALRAEPACRSVVDLGCGEGVLVRAMLAQGDIESVVGIDPAPTALTRALRRVKYDKRFRALQGSAFHLEDAAVGKDAVVLMEVIEHIEPSRLAWVEEMVWGRLGTRRVVVTTPNREYNARFEWVAEGGVRHHDHRFEWTREEFLVWARRVAEAYGYSVEVTGVGAVDEEVGPPTQMAVFRRSV